ncbi:MAG TPA: sulfatase-like hydrolase/transferase [Burkholderiales bacterium]|nr:sulfatase-like hydrolase/transferase [Burkholderiales bacterium]
MTDRIKAIANWNARAGSAWARRALLAAILLWPNVVLLAVSREPFGWFDRFTLLGLAVLGILMPLTWSRTSRAFWLWNIPIACSAGVYGSYVLYFHAPPYSGIWGAIRATTFRELFELAVQLHGVALWCLVLLVAYLALAFAEPARPIAMWRHTRIALVCAAAWAALCVIGIPTIWIYPDISYIRPVREEVFHASFPPGMLAQAAKEALKARDAASASIPPIDFHATPGREIYVQIVGESEQYARWAAQLAVSGAAFPASPSTVVFRDNMSQANLTHLALPLILTGAAQPREAGRLPTWLQFAQARGCRTGWLAANEFDGQRLYRHSLDFVFDLHEITRGIDAGIYDDMMLPEFRRILAQGPEKVCLLVHMNGSHMDYERRYRPDQARYPVDRGRDSDRRAYDNSLLKSIAFLDAAIAELARYPEARSFLVYSPDHGENLREDSRQFFSHSHNPPTVYEARIPLVVWASPAFQKQNPRQWRAIRKNAGLPTSNRYLFNTLLWAMGVDQKAKNDVPSLFDDPQNLRGFRRTIAISEDRIFDEKDLQ